MLLTSGCTTTAAVDTGRDLTPVDAVIVPPQNQNAQWSIVTVEEAFQFTKVTVTSWLRLFLLKVHPAVITYSGATTSIVNTITIPTASAPLCFCCYSHYHPGESYLRSKIAKF